MSKMKEYKLPSGKTMRYNISSFHKGTTLYQTILREARTLDLSSATELDEKLILQIGLLALSSTKIEEAILECCDKAVIDGEGFSKEYFEPEDNREDYIPALAEIAKANIMPFMKSLYAQFSTIFQKVKNDIQA